jgi:hypothetical protein
VIVGWGDVLVKESEPPIAPMKTDDTDEEKVEAKEARKPGK